MPTTSSVRTAAELRRAFLDFFQRQGHVEVPSSPLVPSDPTMLFTTAGMVQFKPYYTAAGDVPYTRAVSVQKCLRLTDLENVGLTPRHDTFFEMLGNFSFGPREKGAYFKAEAIAFAWEFVTKTLGLPKDRLYASIFEGEGKLPRDDEAIELWKKIGLPADRIVPLGRKDNFWGPAGGAGACGPCSEIYFDLGEKRPDYLPAGTFWGERPGDPGDRYMEFWNLVFPQFDAAPDGTLTPLARPGIDTGMGIERLALIVQGKSTIFETDVFEPVVNAALMHFGSPGPEHVRAARIMADHVRALTFAMTEGVLPGNEGAGYVLRRLLRRAIARYKLVGGTGYPVLAVLSSIVVDVFESHYPQLRFREQFVQAALRSEEEYFNRAFESGLARLEEYLTRSQSVAGDVAFELHDTYGFPIELTEEIAAAREVAVDREGFERAMDEQRERARAASKFGRTGEARPWTTAISGADSVFLGWTSTRAEGLAVRRWRESDAGTFEVVLDRTPVYAESGGQVADRGTLEAGGAVADLVHVYKDGESVVHRLKMASGSREAFLAAGAKSDVVAEVPAAHRLPTMRHHTATHLLHAALRTVLGDHVHQAGSLVAPDRLRFDYAHFEAPNRDQLDRIERRVAEWILRDREVRWEILPIDQARAKGAMALFGEKYGAQVRVVTVDGVADVGIEPSLELCGGTHVSRTGEIGAFAIVDESAIASGVRRVEALCGHEALAYFKAQGQTLARAAAALQAAPAQLVEQIEKQKAELERLRKEQADAKRGGLEAEMTGLVAGASAAANGRWVVAELQSEADANAARDAADRLRGALGRGAAVLAIKNQGKTTFLAAVSDDLVAEKKMNASDLVKRVAQVTGGSGGGKPHLALAGAKDQGKVAEALDEARRLLAEALGS